MNLAEFQIKHTDKLDEAATDDYRLLLALKRIPLSWRQDLIFAQEQLLVQKYEDRIIFNATGKLWKEKEDPQNAKILAESGSLLSVRKFTNNVFFELKIAFLLFEETCKNALTAASLGYTLDYFLLGDGTMAYMDNLSFRSRAILALLPLLLIVFMILNPFVALLGAAHKKYKSKKNSIWNWKA